MPATKKLADMARSYTGEILSFLTQTGITKRSQCWVTQNNQRLGWRFLAV
jgi:hypothetical protein